jgi:hypothetical protein
LPRGDSPVVIQWAGGHTDFKTTQGYIARGQVEARRIGSPLPPLPPGLFDPDETPEPLAEPSSDLTMPISKPPETKAFSATPMGIEFSKRQFRNSARMLVFRRRELQFPGVSAVS